MTHADLIRAMRILRPDGAWTVSGELVIMDDGSDPPDQQALAAALVQTLEERKTAMMAAVRVRRKAAEEGGIVINGFPVRTDDGSQAKIGDAIKLLEEDPSLSYIDWEGQPGVWAQVDLAKLKTIGLAAGRHVQACFSHSRTLWEQIEAAVDEAALDAIDITTGWPGLE